LIHSEGVRASDASTGIIARLARFGGRSSTSLAHASAALESAACDGQSWPWARGGEGSANGGGMRRGGIPGFGTVREVEIEVVGMEGGAESLQRRRGRGKRCDPKEKL
jgi:hypothetical protein